MVAGRLIAQGKVTKLYLRLLEITMLIYIHRF